MKRSHREAVRRVVSRVRCSSCNHIRLDILDIFNESVMVLCAECGYSEGYNVTFSRVPVNRFQSERVVATLTRGS